MYQPGPSDPISGHMNQQYHLSPEQSSNKPRPDDCAVLNFLPGPLLTVDLDVYFERSTAYFTSDAIARSTAAKLKLESYYKIAVDAAIERNARFVCRTSSATRS